MKYREILIEELKNLPYFNKKAINQLSEQYDLKKGTVDVYISRSLARKELVPLKKGMYITADYFNKNKSDLSYIFYLANTLRQPSYISSWTALQYYNLTTEIVHTIISVTPKITRSYNSKAGNFIYHSMKKDLFSDFSLVKENFNFFIATPAKALFDLIYFKTNQFKGMDIKQIKLLINDLRIDINEMNVKERDNFYLTIRKYLK